MFDRITFADRAQHERGPERVVLEALAHELKVRQELQHILTTLDSLDPPMTMNQVLSMYRETLTDAHRRTQVAIDALNGSVHIDKPNP